MNNSFSTDQQINRSTDQQINRSTKRRCQIFYIADDDLFFNSGC